MRVSAAWEFPRVAELLDRWLLRLFAEARPPAETDRFAASFSCLARHGRVELAAREIDISRRQLERWSRCFLGMGPKEFAQLHRLRTSVAAVQTGIGDPLSGFSDQAHQIREWRRPIGQTPGNYRASPLSRFNDPAGVVHYL
jgi:AraC-like DNA-binding protein